MNTIKCFGSEQAASVARILQEWALAQTNLSINYGKGRPLDRGKDAYRKINRRAVIVY